MNILRGQIAQAKVRTAAKVQRDVASKVGMADKLTPAHRMMAELSARGVRTLFLFSEGQSEIDAFAQEFGNDGEGLASYPGGGGNAGDPAHGSRHEPRAGPPGRPGADGRVRVVARSLALWRIVKCPFVKPCSTRWPSSPSSSAESLPPLTDDMPLVGSGLDSLCIALIVANLEDELGVDPFGLLAGEVPMPETLGDFVAFYEKAAT